MKTAKDPRHIKRIKTVKELFAQGFTNQENASELTKLILKNVKTIDEMISKAAPQRSIDKLNRIDLAILRLGVYELKFTSTPTKVVIDEAVELGKLFGSESTPSFVNGVLGAILEGKVHEENI